MNKGMAKQLFLENGIPTPRGTSLKRGEDAAKIETCGIHFPCVVKPCSGGSSIGVSIVHDKAEYEQALKEAVRWENELVIEEYVKGREFSVGVIDFQALPIIEIAPVEGFYDYKNKYKAGSTVETCPAELSEQITKEMQGYAEKVAEVLGLNTYSRTDFLLDKEGKLLREIIAEVGPEGFLKVENRINSGIEAEHAIIATGGSVVYGAEAMEHLGRIGTVVYLKLPYRELERRLSDIKGRGVVLRDGQTLHDLYEERVPLYEKYADVIVDEHHLNVEQTIEKIMELKERFQ